MLANRTHEEIAFRVTHLDDTVQELRIAATDVMPLPVSGPVSLEYQANGARRGFELDPDQIYFFYEHETLGVSVQQIGIGEGTGQLRPPPRVDMGPQPLPDDRLGIITVKLCVDEEERATRETWTRRLVTRLKAASDIFEKHCRIRFQPIATGTWRSSNHINQFEASYDEFQKQKSPEPADLCIGFSSQYRRPAGPTMLGATRGAFHPWIFIREWPQQVSEPERLEVLVHELGHYLGAAHIPEPDSVMRARLGDRQSLSRKFLIKFDPINTLIMYRVAEEVRFRDVRRMNQLTPAAKLRIYCIYHDLARAQPNDTSARVHMAQMGNPTANIPVPPRPQPSVNTRRAPATGAAGGAGN